MVGKSVLPVAYLRDLQAARPGWAQTLVQRRRNKSRVRWRIAEEVVSAEKVGELSGLSVHLPGDFPAEKLLFHLIKSPSGLLTGGAPKMVVLI